MSETVATLRELSEAWALFKELPADATIPSAAAAVYLGVSDRTLSRMRSDGVGPPYLQYPASDTIKRNQAVRYILSDLRAWRESQRVSSATEAAVRRGLTFQTARDLIEPQPFFLRKPTEADSATANPPRGTDATILAHVLSASEAEAERLVLDDRVEIVFLSLIEAMESPWIDPQARAPWHTAYCAILAAGIARSGSEQEASELRAEIGAPAEGGGGARRPRRPF